MFKNQLHNKNQLYVFIIAAIIAAIKYVVLEIFFK